MHVGNAEELSLFSTYIQGNKFKSNTDKQVILASNEWLPVPFAGREKHDSTTV